MLSLPIPLTHAETLHILVPALMQCPVYNPRSSEAAHPPRRAHATNRSLVPRRKPLRTMENDHEARVNTVSAIKPVAMHPEQGSIGGARWVQSCGPVKLSAAH
jgi:hypothetical protein